MKALETRIWAPEGALRPKNVLSHNFFGRFAIYLAPGRAKYCKHNGWPLWKLARGARPTHFASFDFALNIDFNDFGSKLPIMMIS